MMNMINTGVNFISSIYDRFDSNNYVTCPDIDGGGFSTIIYVGRQPKPSEHLHNINKEFIKSEKVKEDSRVLANKHLSGIPRDKTGEAKIVDLDFKFYDE